MKTTIGIFHNGLRILQDECSTRDEMDSLVQRGRSFLLSLPDAIGHGKDKKVMRTQDRLLSIWNEDNSSLIGVISDDANGIEHRLFGTFNLI